MLSSHHSDIGEQRLVQNIAVLAWETVNNFFIYEVNEQQPHIYLVILSWPRHRCLHNERTKASVRKYFQEPLQLIPDHRQIPLTKSLSKTFRLVEKRNFVSWDGHAQEAAQRSPSIAGVILQQPVGRHQ